MLAPVLFLALHAVPVPQPDVSRLDQRQLLELNEQIEHAIPARWPGATLMSAGVACGFFFGLASMITAFTWAAGFSDPGDNTSRDAFIVSLTGTALSTAMLIAGIIWFRTAAGTRAEYQATLSAIDDRLDAFERGQPPVDVPPPPELPPSPASPSGVTPGSLRVIALDALTREPLPAAKLTLDGQPRAALEVDGLEPGTHQLTAACDGYRDAQEFARVVPGRQVDVTMKLIPEGKEAPSRLSGLVRSAADGKPIAATLEIDGAPLATADARGIFSVDVPPGGHAVRMLAAGYVTQARQLELKEGARVIFNVDLQRVSP